MKILVLNLKTVSLFTRYVTHKNDEHIDTAENLDIIMPLFNFIEYSDNYSDTSEGLWQFERDESSVTNDGNPDYHLLNTSQVF